MAFKNFDIEVWNEQERPTCAVRIQRQSDYTFYDFSDKKFKPASQVKSIYSDLGPSDDPDKQTVATLRLTLDPAQWTDGDYSVYCHDTSSTNSYKPLFEIRQISVFRADATTQKAPNTTEIAGRILDGTVASHKMPGSVGAWMLDVTARLQKIQTKLGI